jgi:cellulose synthase/poly-beta-1,6-N-acetylglucosamine synthase-like glycosyltransferase
MAGAALICLGLLAYTYIGYPLLIGALARLRPRPSRRHPEWEPTVTACVAAYNAAETIEAKLASLVAQQYPAAKLEILVYSDGSTDGTDEIVGAGRLATGASASSAASSGWASPPASTACARPRAARS